eukprot:CAMPEP_0170589118 /NCGR_PEP_ID=MMETSP0224-20130122/11186_1 /TAXON_ID=285029 /ORGANISM="Togula jolla, Strain CCCM 725" /LENGTH=203 /DNA_ID=CAMNT_0010912867 /DNA_START=402 /DNA_END=1013 /DNA_ORIENTATION=+
MHVPHHIRRVDDCLRLDAASISPTAKEAEVVVLALQVDWVAALGLIDALEAVADFADQGVQGVCPVHDHSPGAMRDEHLVDGPLLLPLGKLEVVEEQSLPMGSRVVEPSLQCHHHVVSFLEPRVLIDVDCPEQFLDSQVVEWHIQRLKEGPCVLHHRRRAGAAPLHDHPWDSRLLGLVSLLRNQHCALLDLEQYQGRVVLTAS